ncbi:MAG: hypothetical protein JXQ91_19050 [Vannielia sp.]|uniref:hypothetical protein n=1 Tax=Vannielia sp. TaxID=2813045 RepID=UPI003B8E4009
MTPAVRAFIAHAVAFPMGVAAAYGVIRIFGGLIGIGAPDATGGTALLGLIAAAMAVGALVWVALVGAMLKFRPGPRWWALAVACAVGLLAVGVGLSAQGIFAPIEALTLVLFLLFALGGWASSKRVTEG